MTTDNDEHPEKMDDRFLAGVQLLDRTGARSFQIRYSPDDDPPPTIWTAAVEYREAFGIAHKKHWKVAAGLSPLGAVLRLCEDVIDGGRCVHCNRPTVFVPDSDTRMLDRLGCVYAYDPELRTFRRGCEGNDR